METCVILFLGRDDMKKKIIIICIAVAVVAGASGIGFAVSNSKNDKELESAVDEAVSLALETSEESTQTASAEASIEENTSDEATAKSTTEKSVKDTPEQKATTKKQTTTTEPQVVYKNTPEKPVKTENESPTYKTIQTPTGTIIIDKDDTRKNYDSNGCYWILGQGWIDPDTGEKYGPLNVDESDRVFYFDSEGNRIYLEF